MKMTTELSDADARAVLESLCGPIPLQGLTDALARASCRHCLLWEEGRDGAPCTRCQGMFSVQSLAVTEYIRSLAERSAAGIR